FGRIRLQFLWDRESQGDDHSSCWIRVTQPWAGQGWGVLAIPRVGQEVLVDFLDGDPDQPIVTGRTYNAQQLPPGRLPQSKTQMAFRSKTYKGEGYNELLFEDAPGREQLNLHAQRDMNVVVLNDKSTTVNGNVTETINRQQEININANRYVEVTQNLAIQVKQQMVEVGETYQLLVNGNISVYAEHSIILKTENAFIQLAPNNIDIRGETSVAINGEKVFLNIETNLESHEVSMSEEDILANAFTLNSEFYAVSKDSSGIFNASSKLLTINGNISLNPETAKMSVSGSLLDINAKSADEKSGFSMKAGSISMNRAESSTSIDRKGEVMAVSLKGKYGGEYGSIEGGAKIFSADAEASANVFRGENGKYGFEGRASAQVSAISAEGKACLGTEESFAMICGKMGASAGPSFDLGGKIILDSHKETLKIGGNIRAFAGAEVEGQINWKKVKESFE
ncbi:type VI secretion system Vgr family protein, partial [Actinobacillus porcinus]|uniref:type VI secretion system Vgr family protein n=1 Tax=Actinobacillus porcinus TaxID=51048 RepID=UPI002A920350